MSGGDFWARRKAGVAAEALQEDRAIAAKAEAARDAELAEKTDTELLEELGLPDPETLTEGDDFKVFLTENVPARLRTRALRRLWTTNPIFAHVDGLVDYGEDFTDASNVIENLQTAYQVGKGMTAHVEALLSDADVPEVVPSEAVPDEGVDDLGEGEPTAEIVAVEPALPEVPQVAMLPAGDNDDQEIALDPAPRRMRFSFDETGQSA